MSDTYGRFEAAVSVAVYDDSAVLGALQLCASCFVWKMRQGDAGQWAYVAPENDDDISVSIVRNADADANADADDDDNSRTDESVGAAVQCRKMRL